MGVFIISIALIISVIGGMWLAHRRSIHLGAILGIGLSMLAFAGTLTFMSVNHLFEINKPVCLDWYELSYDPATNWMNGYCQAWFYPPGYQGKPLPVGKAELTK